MPQPGVEEGAAVAELHLAPEPTAVAEARRWLRQHLAGWPEPAWGDAQLLVSEVVTNAVLHARTPILVRLQRGDGRARVEVGDQDPGEPVVKHFSADATTGRGLHLLSTLSAAWGVERGDPGKRVWFEVLGAPVAGDGNGPVQVRIVGLPVAAYLETEEHNDALLREFALLAGGPGAADVPRRVLEVAAEMTARFSSATAGIRASVQEAAARGDTYVDLAYEVPADSSEALLRVADELDEADRWCEEGDLLTLAAPPGVRRFRAWYTAEVRRQLAGGAPTPWPADWG